MQRLAALQFCLWYAAAGRESRSLVTSAQSNGPHEDFLWDLKVSSLRACALACTVDDKCSFFSFWKNSLEVGPLCRGHSQQPASTSKQPISTPDAVTFQVSKFWVSEESQGYSGNTDSTQRTVYMSEDNGSNTGGGVDVSSPCSPIQSTQADAGTGSPTLEELTTGNQEETATVLASDWFNIRCRDSADCTMANSDCFSTRCLCSIGYYYSSGTNTCLRGCAATNLTDSFTRYAFYYIDGYHNKTMVADTPGPCRESCAAEAWCRSFDYEVSTRSVCKLNSVTALDVPSADLRFSTRLYVSHYQRQCN
ncbi:uncharacterized protein LOC112561478 [Pomacea canaliculata]|uniref:uncharacterized protein LOC112561478 n=1 Tax=Pomacea canaliculata TaxID=400727 RepID=UPI000D73A01C|nr:uncharacterized protein LOC112561478 [Pomacea canaliculata]